MRSIEEDREARERYKQHPIYGTDFSKPLPVLIEDVRNELVQARGHIYDITAGIGWKDRLDDLEGLINCGLITLNRIKEEIIQHHIKWADEKLGSSLPFHSRGIGLEWNLSCFICGSSVHEPSLDSVLHNIAAFTDSKEQGEQIVNWFSESFLVGEKNGDDDIKCARLDHRKHEPNWIQVKIGSCDKHLPYLKKLHEITSVYGVIRLHDIKELRSSAANQES